MRNNNREDTTGGRSITSDRKLRSNAAGKVVLAAIVHRHNYLETVHLQTGNQHQRVNDEPPPPLPSSDCSADRSGAKGKRGKFGLLPKREKEKQAKQAGGGGGGGGGGGAGKTTSNKDDKIGGCKLSRLFSKKKQTTLIDSAHLNQTLGGHVTGEPVGEFAKLAAQREADGFTIKGRRLKDDDDYVDDDKLFLRDKNNKQAKSAQVGGFGQNEAASNERVIEFKFDLIVECNQLNSNKRGQLRRENECDFANSKLEVTAGVGCSPVVANGKLLNNVDELLESFVLESADLCIMSTGKQLTANSTANLNPTDQLKFTSKTCKTTDEFDYLNQLVAHSLGRSFHLLNLDSQERQQQTKTPNGFIDYDNEHQRQQQVFKGHNEAAGQIGCDKFIEENYYSIEISATLFLSEPPQSSRKHSTLTTGGGQTTGKGDTAATTKTKHDEHILPPTQMENSTLGNKFSIVDLLLDAPTKNGVFPTCSNLSTSTSGSSGELATTTTTDNEHSSLFGGQSADSERGASNLTCLDCPNLETSLNVLNVIQTKLRLLEQDSSKSFIRSNKLLLVSLKLKRRFNGGLFNNRMCLIDFDQNFLELHPIFESIFNGQALAYLKRRKLHLNLVDQSPLESFTLRSAKEETGSTTTATTTTTTTTLTKQHHQVASNEKLLQAEWLLYKQLSSALIRTLIIVHVRKLANPGAAELRNSCLQPTSEQKVALDLAERRLMEENLLLLEFARSIQRNSATRLKRRKRHLKSHLISSNVSIASNLSANPNLACHNPLSSPLSRLPLESQRRAELYLADATARQQRSFLNGDRKLSLDANLAMVRHHRKHHRADESATISCLDNKLQRQQHRHQLSMQQGPRLGKQHSDFTESSSLSTSSGSQTQRVRSARSSRATSSRHNHYRHNHDRFDDTHLSGSNNFSDSDSVTSANLNSCSSSSCNRLIGGGGGGTSQRFSAKRSRHRRDVELRWMTKQFGRAPQNTATSCNQRRGSIEQIELAALRTSPATSRRSSSISRMLIPQSNVIQIDCEPTRLSQPNNDRDRVDLMGTMSLRRKAGEERRQMEYDGQLLEGANLDNVSDVCSLVAEPPKQLRLEQFLSQLNCSMIAPKTSGNEVENSSQQSNGNLQTASLIGTLQVAGMFNGQQLSADNFNPSDGRVSSGVASLSDTNSSAILSTNRNFQPPVRLISQNSLGQNSSNMNDDNTQIDEDDEDCKSHSSILEHLSSLALESNSKLNSRQQSRQQMSISDSPAAVCKELQQSQQELDLNLILQSPIDGSPMFELGQNKGNYQDGVQQLGANDNNRLATNTGHLQRLLNNSVQLRKANSRVAVKDLNSIGHRLRALSISCQTTGSSSQPSSASPSSGSSGTFISPDGSVCCSSSSSSNDTKLSDQQNEAPQATLIANSDIHARVMRKVIT